MGKGLNLLNMCLFVFCKLNNQNICVKQKNKTKKTKTATSCFFLCVFGCFLVRTPCILAANTSFKLQASDLHRAFFMFCEAFFGALRASEDVGEDWGVNQMSNEIMGT